MAQVNFTISDELKAMLDGALEQSGADSKPEFLEQMINAFNVYKANSVDIDIDLSKYDSVNSSTKEALSDAFKHILTTLDANFSTAKQEAVYISTEKKALEEKEEAYKVELLKVSSDANSQIEAIEIERREFTEKAREEVELLEATKSILVAKNTELEKEFTNVSKIADQVEYITNENKELRDNLHEVEADSKKSEEGLLLQVKTLTGELVEVKQSLFKTGIESENKDKEITTLTGQLSAEREAKINETNSMKKEFEYKLSAIGKELSQVEGKYNQAVGKLEILETVKDEA